MLSLAGVEISEYMQGQAFLGASKPPKARTHIFGSGDRFDGFSDRIRIVRDKQFLYVRNYHKELPAYKDVGYRRNIDMMNELLKLKEEGKLTNDKSIGSEVKKPLKSFTIALLTPRTFIIYLIP